MYTLPLKEAIFHLFKCEYCLVLEHFCPLVYSVVCTGFLHLQTTRRNMTLAVECDVKQQINLNKSIIKYGRLWCFCVIAVFMHFVFHGVPNKLYWKILVLLRLIFLFTNNLCTSEHVIENQFYRRLLRDTLIYCCDFRTVTDGSENNHFQNR